MKIQDLGPDHLCSVFRFISVRRFPEVVQVSKAFRHAFRVDELVRVVPYEPLLVDMFDRYRRENSSHHPYHITFTYQEAIEKENDLYTPEYTAKIKKRKHYRVTPTNIITNISNARSNCTDLWTQYAVRAFDDFVEKFPEDTVQDVFEEAIMWTGASIETLVLSDVFRVAYDKEMHSDFPELFWKQEIDYPDFHDKSCFLAPSCYVSELARAANLCQHLAIEPDKPPLWYSVFQFFVDVASLHEDLRHTRPSLVAAAALSCTLAFERRWHWSAQLHHLTGVSYETLDPLVSAIVTHAYKQFRYTWFENKYSQPPYACYEAIEGFFVDMTNPNSGTFLRFRPVDKEKNDTPV